MILFNLALERCVAIDEICVKGVRGCFPDKRCALLAKYVFEF